MAVVNLRNIESPCEEEKDKREKPLSGFFYKVSNHQELFLIGQSFYKDYCASIKNFALASTGYQNSQQRTILGIASYFDQKDDLDIAIISDNLTGGIFKELIAVSQLQELNLGEGVLDIHSFYGHFDFLNLMHLLELQRNSPGGYERILNNLIAEYDVIFWDVPELALIQKDTKLYFQTIQKFEKLSIIVAKGKSNKSEIEEIADFFSGYGINLKGLLFEKT